MLSVADGELSREALAAQVQELLAALFEQLIRSHLTKRCQHLAYTFSNVRDRIINIAVGTAKGFFDDAVANSELCEVLRR